MGFSTGYKSVQNNLGLIHKESRRFPKNHIALGGAGEVSEYNESFSKELSQSTLEKSREKARAEVKNQRRRSFVYMIIISPIVILTLWTILKYYLKLLSLG